MCQAVWRSPLLPMRPEMENGHSYATLDGVRRGNRFKRDLLAYLEAYGNKKTGPLVDQLEKYDFGAVRAGLIASVPTRQAIDELDSEKQTLWGWPALKDAIQQIPLGGGNNTMGKKPQIIIQVRSMSHRRRLKASLLGVLTTHTQIPDIFSGNARTNRQMAKGDVFRRSLTITTQGFELV